MIRRHPYSSAFGRWLHRYYFFEVIHICIYFWALGAQISDGRNIWVMEVRRSFNHDVCLADVTVCWFKVSLQLIHCYGEFVGCYWSKVKSIAFQVSAPALEVSIIFGLRDCFISRFIASVLLELGGFSLVTVSWDLRFITLRWEGWFEFNHSPNFPRYFLFLCWIQVLCFP